MTHGKQTCKILKEIRQEIADKNEIAYTTSECHYQGECTGTCSKCEEELKYIENELHRQKQMGKAAVVAGISLGIAGTFSACNNAPQQSNMPTSKQEITTGTENVDTIPIIPKECLLNGIIETEGFVIPPPEGDIVSVKNFDIESENKDSIFCEIVGEVETIVDTVEKSSFDMPEIVLEEESPMFIAGGIRPIKNTVKKVYKVKSNKK